MELAGNCEVSYGAQSLAGKIFSLKDLSRLFRANPSRIDSHNWNRVAVGILKLIFGHTFQNTILRFAISVMLVTDLREGGYKFKSFTAKDAKKGREAREENQSGHRIG